MVLNIEPKVPGSKSAEIQAYFASKNWRFMEASESLQKCGFPGEKIPPLAKILGIPCLLYPGDHCLSQEWSSTIL